MRIKAFVQGLTPHQLFALLLLAFIPGMGLYDFFTRGEAREALMVLDIVKNGDWILPRGYDHTITTKPPLLHWLAAIFSRLLGDASAFAIRLPSALFSLFALATFIYFLRKELTEKGKLLFITLLMFSFEWMRGSLTARVDMVHAASLSTGLLVGFLAHRDKSWKLSALCSLLLGLATLGKGPVALLLAALILGIWIILRASNITKSLLTLSLILFGASVIGGSWYLVAYLEAPAEFWAFFRYESIDRFTSSMEDKPHQHSIVYLLGVLLIGLLPWTVFHLMKAAQAFGRRRGSLRSFLREGNALLVFSFLTFAVVFLFYSVPASKRSVYLLACYPFISLASALSAQDSLSAKNFLIFKYAAVVLCGLVFIVQTIALPLFIVPAKSERRLAEIVLTERQGTESVFSYGSEFYGASFYSGIAFHGIRSGDEAAIFTMNEQLKMQPPLQRGDLVIVLESDFANAVKKVAERGFRLLPASSTTVGRKKVVVARAS